MPNNINQRNNNYQRVPQQQNLMSINEIYQNLIKERNLVIQLQENYKKMNEELKNHIKNLQS